MSMLLDAACLAKCSSWASVSAVVAWVPGEAVPRRILLGAMVGGQPAFELFEVMIGLSGLWTGRSCVVKRSSDADQCTPHQLQLLLGKERWTERVDSMGGVT